VEQTLAGEDSEILDRSDPECGGLAKVWRTTEEEFIGQGESDKKSDQRGYTTYFGHNQRP
jgi:hypothetical protein